MAIELDLSTSKFGVPFAGAYFRIVHTSVIRTADPAMRHVARVDIAGYATKPTDETDTIESRSYHVNVEAIDGQTGDTYLAKVYAWLMTQPDLAGCTAV